jgi:hypothetical protein
VYCFLLSVYEINNKQIDEVDRGMYKLLGEKGELSSTRFSCFLRYRNPRSREGGYEA